MPVPPPYVPPLSREVTARWGDLTGTAPELPSPLPGPDEEPRGLHLARPLTRREKAMLLLMLGFMMVLPTAVPRAHTAPRETAMQSDPDLQPAERAEDNFAGSAFYFLDALEPATPVSEAVDDTISTLQPMAFRGSATDNDRALRCLTLAVYYEAGLEPDAGQRAVAQVVLNRVRHPAYPDTVCGVVFQGSERATGCQFTFTCDGALGRNPIAFHWRRARAVAVDALAGNSRAMIDAATHYHASYVAPYWAPGLRYLGTIGAHRFYGWKGPAGQPEVFISRYAGGEPAARPHPRTFVSREASTTLDPVELEKVYEREYAEAFSEMQRVTQEQQLKQAQAADEARRHGREIPETASPGQLSAGTALTPETMRTDEKLPGISQIRPEYEAAGSWKRRPPG